MSWGSSKPGGVGHTHALWRRQSHLVSRRQTLRWFWACALLYWKSYCRAAGRSGTVSVFDRCRRADRKSEMLRGRERVWARRASLEVRRERGDRHPASARGDCVGRGCAHAQPETHGGSQAQRIGAVGDDVRRRRRGTRGRGSEVSLVYPVNQIELVRETDAHSGHKRVHACPARVVLRPSAMECVAAQVWLAQVTGQVACPLRGFLAQHCD
jgi:hypothetical protein